MATDVKLIVFTDLDGTLIDHNTYSWDGARPALQALKQISAGVVLASSKTSAEISPLRSELGLDDWPAIVENGAGLLPAKVHDVQGGSQYGNLREVLAEMPHEMRCLFRGFGDVTADEVAQMTGLSPKAAALAQERQFSEPGQWLGNEAGKSAFIAFLKNLGVQAQQGGRFLTLSFGGNKVDQMRKIVDTYHPAHTIALGDAPNDVQMLEHAEFGVVVCNPHRPPLPPLERENDGFVIRTALEGPKGWNKAILDLLNRLGLH